VSEQDEEFEKFGWERLLLGLLLRWWSFGRGAGDRK